MSATDKTTKDRRPAGGDSAREPVTVRETGGACQNAERQEDEMRYQVQMIMGGQVLERGKSWPVEQGNYAEAHKEVDRLNNASDQTRYHPAWFVVKVN